MKFNDPERQKRFEEMNAQGLSLQSLIASFNASKLMFLELLAEGPGDNPMQWTEKIVEMESKLDRAGDQLLRTAEKLNHVLTKEVLFKLGDRLGREVVDVLNGHVNETTRNKIVDELVPRMASVIADCRN